MRSIEELGEFSQVGNITFTDKSNEAYRTYASLYLDFVDDNMNHFKWRDIDISPIQNLTDGASDEEIIKAYLDCAVGIAKTAISSRYYTSPEKIYEDYPMLKDRKEEIEK